MGNLTVMPPSVEMFNQLMRVFDPQPAPPVRQSLGAHVSGVDFIVDAIEQLLESDEMTPELQNELGTRLVEAIAGTKAKVDATAAVLAMYEGVEAATAKEITRLQERATRYKRRREHLELYVLAVLETSKLPRIDGQTSALILRKNPPRCIVDEGANLPEHLMRQPPTPAPVPAKDLIKRALVAGEAVPGCRLEHSNRLVRE
jgi:Siphovirus Gp157